MMQFVAFPRELITVVATLMSSDSYINFACTCKYIANILRDLRKQRWLNRHPECTVIEFIRQTFSYNSGPNKSCDMAIYINSTSDGMKLWIYLSEVRLQSGEINYGRIDLHVALPAAMIDQFKQYTRRHFRIGFGADPKHTNLRFIATGRATIKQYKMSMSISDWNEHIIIHTRRIRLY